MRFTERHFPEYIPPTEKKGNATRRCVLYVANITSVEKQDIMVLNVKLLYVPHHVSAITTPRKNSETVFLYFL